MDQFGLVLICVLAISDVEECQENEALITLRLEVKILLCLNNLMSVCCAGGF